MHEVAIKINGEAWKIFLLGHYQTRKEAMDVMNRYPIDLQSLKPWVRSLASLKNAYASVIALGRGFMS